MTDTIAAVATPAGGGVSIIRVSGSGAIAVVRRLWRGGCDFESHRVYYGHVVEAGAVLDEALLIVMRAPRSYTAEDVAEFHCHGGQAVTDAVLAAALRNGARLAEPGEFTKRAFLNGRIDLSRAEAVGELIQARTELARRAAMRRLDGHTARRAQGLAEKVTAALARIEAGIDFPEEVGDGDYGAALAEIVSDLTGWLKDAESGRMLQEGARVAIVGLPNVGKSSLMNRLTGEDVAIVSETAGTTRDVLRETADIGGVPVRFADTAGIRDADGELERLGVARALKEMETADAALFVTTGEDMGAELAARLAGVPALAAVNKADLGMTAGAALLARFGAERVVAVSALTGEGIDALKAALRALLLGGGGLEGDLPASARQRDALSRALTAARAAMAACADGLPPDCVAIDLRDALSALGEVTGENLDEAVIDRVFADFCLGK